MSTTAEILDALLERARWASTDAVLVDVGDVASSYQHLV